MKAIRSILVVAVLCGCNNTTISSQTPDGGSGSTGQGQHAIHVHVSGSGVVSATAPSFSCRSDCQQSADATATVHLTAVPDAGWTFAGWQGACSGTATCDVAMSADHDLTATFTAAPPTPPGSARISVKPVGSGTGRVTSIPAGIDCPAASCSLLVQVGTLVTLTAAADSSSTFAGWGGGCSGGDCSINASTDTTVWANFTLNAPPPPPPPPGPPAQCAGLTPGAAGPPVSLSTSTPAFCLPPMGDGMSTAGLPGSGSVGGLTLSVADESTGSQRAYLYSGPYGAFTPQPDGFTGVFSNTNIANVSTFDAVHYDHNGNYVSGTGRTLRGIAAVSGSPSIGGVLLAGDFNWYGEASRHQAMFMTTNGFFSWSHDLASAGAVFGLGLDANNRALIITDGGGGTISAQWFGNNGSELTGEFAIIRNFQAGANTWFETGPLIGGGLAVRRVDQQNDAKGRPYRTSQWLVIVPAGAAAGQPAPQWLTTRPNTNMAIARSGKAYAMLPLGAPATACAQQVGVLAPDGTACGSFDAGISPGQCRTEDMALGLDGTLLELLPVDQASANTCPYRWWLHALQ